MLQHIYIKNFAIVDTLEIDFTDGLAVLTGETGAGKSLWVDAMGLALGQRADAQWIRTGAERAEISVSFDISKQPQVQQWLKDEALDADNECILRRSISREGNSRSTVNGSVLPLQKIRDLAGLLIQIHSQHQQQHLVQADKQRHYLDLYANNQKCLSQIQQLYQQWKNTQSDIDTLLGKSDNKAQEIEFLRYQLDELDQLQLQPGEWESLSRQHQQFHHAHELIQQLNQAITLTVENEDVSAAQLIRQAQLSLTDIKISDPQLDAIKELLETAAIHLNEAGSELQHYRNHFDISGSDIASIEKRLSFIYDLARKHHCNPQDLTDIHQSLQNKLDTLLALDDKVAALTLHLEQLEKRYHLLANRLTKQRQQAAETFEKHITKSMREMDIHDGLFKVDFIAVPQQPNAFGHEKVQFMVQTNAGQPCQPLHKIASGGELSRISLALYVLIAAQAQTPTLIFDEVDTGISGKTASTVGKLLRQLGTHSQVLCITHLPQVASYGHHHYKACKATLNKLTTTTIEKLSDTQRIDEIARLLGGSTITKQTLAHAAELLEVI